MKQAKCIALGAAAALSVYTLLSALLALLVVRGTIPEGGIPACAHAFALIAVFCGALLSSGGAGERFVTAFSCAAAFCCASVLLGFLACNALQPRRVMLLALVSLAGGAIACLARSGGGYKRKKHRNHSHK